MLYTWHTNTDTLRLAEHRHGELLRAVEAAYPDLQVYRVEERALTDFVVASLTDPGRPPSALATPRTTVEYEVELWPPPPAPGWHTLDEKAMHGLRLHIVAENGRWRTAKIDYMARGISRFTLAADPSLTSEEEEADGDPTD